MGAAAVRAQNGTATFTFHPSGYTTNVNFNQGQQQHSAPPTIMSCEACQTNFNLFKRKKICKYCDRIFCSSCVHRYRDPDNNRMTYRQCNTCKVLMSGKFTRSDLMKWKVKELRILLNKRNVSTSTCKEKHDLIDLLFINFAKSPQESAEVEDLESLSRQPSSLSGSTVSSGGTQDHNNQPQGSQNTSPQEPAPPPGPETEVDRQERLRQRQEEEMRRAILRQEILGEEEEEEAPQETATARVRMNLGEIKTLEDVDSLTVRQLKEVLVTNFVNYKGCCEKPELVDRVKRLWKEHKANEQKVKDIDSPETADVNGETNPGGEKGEDDICKICMDAAIDCVLLECGHMISCTQCGRRLNECPICRQYVVRVVHTFKS